MNVRRTVLSAVVLALAAASTLTALPVSYDYFINTSSGAGVANLYFLLAPSLDPSPQLTATITDFQLDGGSLSGSPMLIGAASGALPGTVTLENTDVRNEYNEDFTLGTGLRFRVTLDGLTLPAGNVDPGSTFAFGIFQGATPLFTTDPLGDILRINVAADGTVTTEGLAPVPEPGAIGLTCIGLAALMLGVRRRPRER